MYMKDNTELFYIIENEKIDVEKNISEAKKIYSDLTNKIHIIYSQDYLSQLVSIFQKVDFEETEKVIILSNHLIGPIYPLQEVFEKMDKVSCDFWTLTKAGKNIERNLTEHFQFYFCVFNKSFFQNANIQKCFLEDRYIKDEVEFSNMLKECGVYGETYINTDKWEERTLDYRIDVSIEAPCLLVKKYAYPYIRFEAFTAEMDLNDEVKELMSYIKETQIYDINRVWEYLMASCNIADIYTKLSLNYIYSTELSVAEGKKYANVALLVHVYYEDLVTECLDYLEPLAEVIDIYISTGNDITYEILNEEIARREINIKEVRKIENRGRDVASLLYYCKDIWHRYEYLGFIHDKKTSGAHVVLQGDKCRYLMWENLVASKAYVYNIIEGFLREDKLGLVIPPMPKNDCYRGLFWASWGENFENAKRLAQRLQLQVPMDEKKQAFAFTTSFWCRTRALEKLYKCQFDISEFDLTPFPLDGALSHAIERIFPFVAQDAGYYTASAETEEFAALELAYYFNRIREVIGDYQNRIVLGIRPILGFVSRYKKIYVYGCGLISNEVTQVLQVNNIKYEGYVVTEKEVDVFNDKQVYSINELHADEETGIIVAVGIKIKSEIEKLLKERGFDYFLWRQ